MKIAFHLKRTSVAQPAAALFLASEHASHLLEICSRQRLEAVPPVYSCAGGFLVKLPVSVNSPIPLAIRLQKLGTDLYLPVDARLVPPLFEDEARALGRDRGLVFLPGDRILEFDRRRPLPATAFLTASAMERRSWSPLQATDNLAERLLEITLDLPEPPADEILQEGGEDIGTEAPRPDQASLPARLTGRAVLGAGIALTWLGNALHLKALSQLGAGGIGKALSLAPRLTESLLGKQEAALRALLRDFREGNIERALRRALPLSNESDRGARPAASAQLPYHGLLYSLAGILGKWRGPSHYWVTPFDVRSQLEREYRTQAEKATQRGDYRRAAFIYAKLLSDLGMAARVLEKGGLYVDAATIYLQKLHDERSAARAYEAGSLIDKALEIYRRRGEHEDAGDLLRHIGDDEAALREYQAAAKKLVQKGSSYYQAGDLLLAKAQRPDLATHYYQLGWSARPEGSPVPCAVRLAKLAANEESTKNLFLLLSQAEEYFGSAGGDSEAAEFYNAIAQLAERPHLAQSCEELRDRALVGLAGRMRRRVRGGTGGPDLVSTLLGHPWWPVPVSSDASFAVKAHARGTRTKAGQAARPLATVPGQIRLVTAACSASDSGEVFLGLKSGEVYCYRPDRGELQHVWIGDLRDDQLTVLDIPDFEERPPPGAIVSMATDAKGTTLVLLQHSDPCSFVVACRRGLDGKYQRIDAYARQVSNDDWLTPIGMVSGQPGYAAWFGGDLYLMQGSPRVPIQHFEWLSHQTQHPVAGLVIVPDTPESPGRALLLGSNSIWSIDNILARRFPKAKHLAWAPSVPEKGGLYHPLVSWLHASPDEIEFTGIGRENCLCWSKFCLKHEHVNATNSDGRHRYLAAAIIRPGLVAAVTDTAVEWVKCGSAVFTRQGRTPLPFSSAVACFPHQLTKQLVIISAEGAITCVPFWQPRVCY
jgi:tetratricopeptide (TPR) repeat protein